MNDQEKIAFEWALNQSYGSVAARNALILAKYIDRTIAPLDAITDRNALLDAEQADHQILESCDGSCMTVRRWCPKCDCIRKHIYISDIYVECCECFELGRQAD